MLNSKASCQGFLETSTPAAISRQIRQDEECCRSQRLPTLLALYLPSPKSELAQAIALQLCPESVMYSRSLRMAQYTGVTRGIKDYLASMTHHEKPLPSDPRLEETPMEPSSAALQTAIRVLRFYSNSPFRADHQVIASLEEATEFLKSRPQASQVSPVLDIPRFRPSKLPESKSSKHRKRCYICQTYIMNHHPEYQALCESCGNFNLASCELSLPENLYLSGRRALVTGGRLNLGYHTALRLLRCGAKVIVSTRYPADAQSRYLAEQDSPAWTGSLRIVGADFRTASDVFHLVDMVKSILTAWDDHSTPKLDILINNAAQTLTDPLAKEEAAVLREQKLLEVPKTSFPLLLSESTYSARIRGGMAHQTNFLARVEPESTLGEIRDRQVGKIDEHNSMTPDGNQAVTSIAKGESGTSSWMQSIQEIPYEDIISAHSINTFVPLILIREFLPLMGSPKSATLPIFHATFVKPLAHIINVTSREGIFESAPNPSRMKNGKHVHTNITKAALNMLTETEAGPAWKERRVAINSVDPGYMSAAPEVAAHSFPCPIGWEDGVGRVLWPIAVGEKGKGIWGRFLKHFGAVKVEVGVGK